MRLKSIGSYIQENAAAKQLCFHGHFEARVLLLRGIAIEKVVLKATEE